MRSKVDFLKLWMKSQGYRLHHICLSGIGWRTPQRHIHQVLFIPPNVLMASLYRSNDLILPCLFIWTLAEMSACINMYNTYCTCWLTQCWTLKWPKTSPKSHKQGVTGQDMHIHTLLTRGGATEPPYKIFVDCTKWSRLDDVWQAALIAGALRNSHVHCFSLCYAIVKVAFHHKKTWLYC